MIEIPLDYRNRVINDNGKLWIDELSGLIEEYVYKFKLKNIDLVPKLTINFVFYAYSDIYGDVVVKFCKSDNGIRDEINFIKNCNSSYMVKMFYYNYDDKVIILERIKPGDSLEKFGDINYRLQVVKLIYDDIYFNVGSSNCKKYYTSFCNKANNDIIINNLDNECRLMLKTALEFYSEIEKSNLQECILHRDLHYKNILKDDNVFKTIDPHGVFGYRVFELPQIIRSELKIINNDYLRLNDIILSVSKCFNFDFKIVCKVLYIDTVEKILYFTLASYEKKFINDCKRICNEIISYL